MQILEENIFLKNLPDKILIFSQSLAPGGSEKQAVLLGKILHKLGYKVVFIIYYSYESGSRLSKELQEENIEIIELKGNIILKTLRFFNAIRLQQPSLIFNYLLLPNLLGGLAGIFYRKISIGGIRSAAIPKYKLPLYKITHNWLTVKTVINNYTGKEFLIKKGFDPKKFVVIPNTIYVPAFQENKDTCNNPISIISVGRFTFEKDYSTALKSILILKSYCLNIQYIIIGWGNLYDVIKSKVSQFGLQKEVTIIINPENLADYYKSADIFLQTSSNEGISNTVMEAMSFSLPIVCTDAGDNSRLVIDGSNGFICKVGDYTGIAAKLGILINDKDKRLEFGQNGLIHLRANYSNDIFTKNYLELIELLHAK
jgi:glycosyltransferase involved in cell wall biosynthesis